jgi:hypothetical protein
VLSPSVRVATASDADLLAAFSCSRGLWFEDEVEEFLQRYALTYAAERAPLDHQLLLFVDDDELIAVGGHEQALLPGGLVGTHLTVAAIDLSHQGAKLTDGGRLSDYVLDALLGDALDAEARGAVRREPIAHALVARENGRSLAVLNRRGFGDPRVDSFDARYVHLYARIV